MSVVPPAIVGGRGEPLACRLPRLCGLAHVALEHEGADLGVRVVCDLKHALEHTQHGHGEDHAGDGPDGAKHGHAHEDGDGVQEHGPAHEHRVERVADGSLHDGGQHKGHHAVVQVQGHKGEGQGQEHGDDGADDGDEVEPECGEREDEGRGHVQVAVNRAVDGRCEEGEKSLRVEVLLHHSHLVRLGPVAARARVARLAREGEEHEHEKDDEEVAQRHAHEADDPPDAHLDGVLRSHLSRVRDEHLKDRIPVHRAREVAVLEHEAQLVHLAAHLVQELVRVLEQAAHRGEGLGDEEPEAAAHEGEHYEHAQQAGHLNARDHVRAPEGLGPGGGVGPALLAAAEHTQSRALERELHGVVEGLGEGLDDG
mmetsp:Transcript_14886/g.45484  ORF Transcript_14886/g.45484 Transcript_14886/m.45484 type:complete len:369 (-) Transcript_14886:292-1398(-)